ncbi:MAG: asparagine synthase (glutamine-hydrolyzing) [Stenotrophomonas sp.]
MCGLAGLWAPASGLGQEELVQLGRQMGDAIAHRGPDDHGVWADASSGLALAHRRLSIHDLSPLGHQPMASPDGRYQLVYNGEIYNFQALRMELQGLGHVFSGHSDTEVLLAAIVQWGLQTALERSNGMFAIALWDTQQQRLALARDRVGKKPLYYGWAGRSLVFGSELKALWQHPDFDNPVNPDALALLLQLDYIPSPHSIHRHCWKLMPGCVLWLDAAGVQAGPAGHQPRLAQRPFWSATAAMRQALASPFAGSFSDGVEAVDGLLRDAVDLRSVADVPVGVFLSGGTDSALVASMMQARGQGRVRSFSIGFTGSSHDEAPLAKAVASHLGTEHTELYVDGADALAVVPQLPAMFDEPFADASQVPTALVARLARSKVTVALSGDGGDELFFGYLRYSRALRNWSMLRKVPAAMRRQLGGGVGEAARTGGLAAVRAELEAFGIGDVYRHRVQRWRDPLAVVHGAGEGALDSLYQQADPLHGAGVPADAMMLADFACYLPDDLLVKVDRTSMAVGLEARAPLLDWRLAELAWSMPLQFKHDGRHSKALLKQVLCRYLPESMVYRPKRGFGAPVSQWLGEALQPWADGLLDEQRLRREGYFDADAISAIWQQFKAGQRKWHTHLWGVLMFQSWLEHWQHSRRPFGRAPH